jgi:capsule biosynthesis phosphatase
MKEWAGCCNETYGAVVPLVGGGYGLNDEHATPIRFCPFCGWDLSLPIEQSPARFQTLEEALASLLKSDVPLRICFDVDGLVADHAGSPLYADREPYSWVPDLIRQLKEAGHTLIFQTARYMNMYDGNQYKAHLRGWSELRFWLAKHEIPFDEVYLGKAGADLYVDDRGCRVESDGGITQWRRNFVPTVARAQAIKTRFKTQK